ncbi:unnamed protein product [Nesidiocoris tenuis]|uniref:Uncharacterized protein n=1 Tax=Nesidiocoris tenuis TaxID=355587 RepID=A0A6H5GFE3_9HEMI|nr:unnamed protein product [Nesidiocoris tenuis]
MTINLREIGIIEQRGSYRVEPNQNGFVLHIQEIDCHKNSEIEEAHSVKRSITRNYAVSSVSISVPANASPYGPGAEHLNAPPVECDLMRSNLRSNRDRYQEVEVIRNANQFSLVEPRSTYALAFTCSD